VSAKAPVPEVKINVYGISDVGAVRTNNEDCLLIVEMTSGADGLVPEVLEHTVQERGSLFIVSDGMGGAEAGEVASRLVVDGIRDELAEVPLDASPEEAIKGAVERVNLSVWNDAQQNAQRNGMGATLAAAWIRGIEVFIAGVGDSRVYLLRAGKMRQLTRDQSMVESLVEVGMLDRAEADHHPQRNVILQAMGVRPEVVVAIERLELRRGDFLLLCSDGLSGKMTAEEMRDCILTTAALPEACHRMIHIAKARGGEDNITVVVAEFDGEGLPETTLNERTTRTFQSLSGYNFTAGAGYAPPPPAKPTHSFGSENTGDEAESAKVFPPDASPSSPHDPTRTLSSDAPPRPQHSGTSLMGSGAYPKMPKPEKKD
jgi:serine/threonine protein phosphatase PrpC